MKTGIVIADIMMKNPVTVSPDTDMLSCSKLFAEKKIDSLIAVDKDEKAVGLITEKDIVRKVIAKDKNPKKTPLSEIMGSRLITVRPNQDISEAMKVMRDEKIRQVPVIEKGKLVGLLVQMQILNIEPQLFEIMVEKAESSRSPTPRKVFEKEGVCQACGRYARKLNESEGMLLCKECLE